MKTTIEIPSSLLEEAKKVAGREGTTVKALVIESLRRILADRKRKSSFRLRKVTFKGNGLQPHVAGASWEQMREMVYEGRGS